MGTRAMVLLKSGGTYRCYYRQYDGYPTVLGSQLICALRTRQNWEDIAKVCHLADENVAVLEPEEAYLRVQGDLDYIYVVELKPKVSLQIYRTTNPWKLPRFIFPIWGSYAEFFPSPPDVVSRMAEVERCTSITLAALRKYHEALGG